MDSNIIISALPFGGNPRKIFDLTSNDKIQCFTSDKAIEEIKEVLLNKFKLTIEEWTIVMEVLNEVLNIIPVVELPKVSKLRDMRDLHILAVAELCEPDYILSGDLDLLVLESYKDIPILKPSDFLAVFNN